ncbi:hypothetical protein PV08_04247 [Exophiala spinifera]|uniref:Uncharacterized protein n=1 Tax=Exophiala spinifera TaxID=91928 RepID=A0A0D1YPF9_9EURO|nr:uncharacterized protein PV08_04247 [Exophiala spinifera]KIW17056.1 hypothetical protein PV08_04247 [Exophiala spinifera]
MAHGLGARAAQYKARIDDLAIRGSESMRILSNVLDKKANLPTRVSYLSRPKMHIPTPIGFEADSHSTLRTADEVIAAVSAASDRSEKGICIVENISPTYILELGAAWDVDPEFFARHAASPRPQDLWVHRKWEKNGTPPDAHHLSGVYECGGPAWTETAVRKLSVNYCDRVIHKDSGWPVNLSTVMSYCIVASQRQRGTYLLLVDPPLKMPMSPTSSSNVHTACDMTLRFPYAGNRGGLLMPLDLPGEEEHRSLFDAVEHMLRQHPWQLDLILHRPSAFPGVPFLYLMASSLSQDLLQSLRKRLHKISFLDVRRPDWNLTDRLHDIRQELNTIQASLQETEAYEPTLVEDFFTDLKNDVPKDEHRKVFRRTPGERLRDLLGEANQTHKLVLETFDILIGTTAVLDSKESRRQTEESLKQTRQTILLTGLATVYLPLSLATSVFGMNLKEMTGSGPHAWTFAVTVAGLVAATVIIFGSLFFKGVIIPVKRLWNGSEREDR